ncbi:sensor histidine kinase [Streptomyces sp. NPDC007088]|uniref:sensor histidine kinase n=1 Tax=Streptomyces sp. NPDC007088 TaxID=3364773 RepID=UPI003676CD5D
MPASGPRPPRGARPRRAATALLEAARAVTTATRHPARRHAPLTGASSRTWARAVPYGVAAVFTLILLPVTLVVLTQDYRLNGGIAGAAATVQAVPLLLAVTRPVPAWGMVLFAHLVTAIALLWAPGLEGRSWPWAPPGIVGYLVLMVFLGLRERRRTLIGVWLTTGVAGLGFQVASPEHSAGNWVLLLVLSGGLLALSGAVRERLDVQRKLSEQESISEEERARRTLLEERTRIARELHDVVAHHMSVITVQADSAPYRIADLPGPARAEFESIAASARESLAEMRRLLTVLRSDGVSGERTPQPGLDRLEQLVGATVRAGVSVELSGPEIMLVRQLAELSPAVDLSAYRIVQEALSNVVRHAPGSFTSVSVGLTPRHLTVLVVNGPARSGASRVEEVSAGSGQGLAGMRERVRLVGGELDTGPLPGGGFRVAALLPLGAEAEDLPA